MATTPEAKEFVATLEHLFIPCPRALKARYHHGREIHRCSGCDHPRCRGNFPFDEDVCQAKWLRLKELGTEEVFAALSPKERAFFWYVAFRMEHIDNDTPGPKWTEERINNLLNHLINEGDFERFVLRFYDEAHDPILEDDDDYVFADS